MNAKHFRKSLAGLLAATAFLPACASKPNGGESAAAALTGVKTETIHLRNLPEAYQAVGTVRSATSSILGAEIGGAVLEIRVKPGDRVKRGEVLALLDNRTPRAGLEAAQAGVEEAKYGVAAADHELQAAVAEQKLAEDTFRRYQQLLKRNSVTRQEYDGAQARARAAAANVAALEARKGQMEAQGRQSQAQLASAQTLLSHSKVVSPTDGVVTAKLVDAGTLVMPGTPLLTVEDAAHYRLEANVPQALLSKIHLGQKTQVRLDQSEWAGTVIEIVPAADPSTRTFVVKVALPSSCPCQSGEYGTGEFLVGEKKAFAVPRSAVVERGELAGLYVVNAQGIAEYRLVTRGDTFGERVEILSGLSDGERVAESRLDQLHDGAQVVPE